MRVISLFDGLSCARMALSRLNIDPELYYASEIDGKAMHCTHVNYPDTKFVGSVIGLKFDGSADLLIGGSPCQDLSTANSKGTGLNSARSGLFYEYVRILNEVKPTYFLFENVATMTTKSRQTITRELGVKPILIDAALVSAQRRRRWYWTNIEGIEQPEDRNILLQDILEDHPNAKYNHSRKAIDYMDRADTTGRTKWDYQYHSESTDPKSVTVVSNFRKGVPNNVLADHIHNVFRRFTPVECERLQGIPDDYTKSASDSKRYEMIGNGFQVDVIAHILSYMR